ncbi:MAG: hypothetical protein JWL59_4226 [Chthoniobacteraceae bacterium]|nr:hypothetical protein [Chthoniobacteraceae bacterium]
MNPSTLLRALFPRSRQPVTWQAVVPLGIFLLVFVTVSFGLEWRGVVRFNYRPAFFLLLVTPWIWWMQHAGGSGLGKGRSIAAVLIRLVLVGAFILALAEPRAVRRSDKLSVVYALDVSDSMGEKVSDQALGWVMSTVAKKPEKDEAGLVVFGRDAAVELPPRQTFPFEAMNSRVGRDGSNLSKALGLAAAVLPEANQGRIVLITDGNETDGAVSTQLDALKSRGIAVDVLPIAFDYTKEVWLERVDLPRVVKAGETYEASILLNALQPGSGKLILQENGKVISEKEVTFPAGKSRFALPLYMREPGFYQYVATVEPKPGEDGWKENNVAMGELYLRGEGKVLIVTDAKSDTRDWETFSEALKASERIVQVRMAYEFPRDAISLLPYDLIVFPNVPADAFDPVQLQALRDAIYNQGTGFLMLGGTQSFGPGGYHHSVVEEALPVTMDVTQKKVLPKGALAVVLHTCEFAEGNTWAKRIAKEAIRVLGAQDEVGLLAYTYGAGTGDQWVFPLTPAREYDKLAVLINKLEPGDMPSFQNIMQMALTGLQGSDAASKHCIVVSDGDPSPPTPALIQGFIAAKVSVSMVAINPHGGQDISIMQTIAQATGGRYYFPQDPAELPSIFIKEAKTLKRSMVQNRNFTPTVEFPSPILKGIESVPPLHGLVLTTAKPRANIVLRAPPAEGEEAGDIDPLLATWRFGLGTTAAWTSDLAPNWASDWVGWEKYQPFVKQLVTELSRVEQKHDLHMESFASNGQGMINVEDFAAAETFLELAAKVTGPRGESISIPLRQVAPRRYTATFPLWGKGRYQVMVAGSGAAGSGGMGGGGQADAKGGSAPAPIERQEQITGGFALPYSPEYLRFRSDSLLLKEIAQRTGGRVLSATDLDVFSPVRAPRESSRPVFDWFLLALALLLPADVAVRRVQLDWSVIGGWFKRKTAAAPSGETMSALLGRKQQVKTTLGALREEQRPPPLTNFPRPTTVPTPPSAPSAESPKAPPVTEKLPESTTGRLLARKRKRADEGEK